LPLAQAVFPRRGDAEGAASQRPYGLHCWHRSAFIGVHLRFLIPELLGHRCEPIGTDLQAAQRLAIIGADRCESVANSSGGSLVAAGKAGLGAAGYTGANAALRYA
jgi:hypothetical protein